MQLSIILTVGLLLAWVGERIVENPVARYTLTAVGAVLVLGALVLRLFRASSAKNVALARSQPYPEVLKKQSRNQETSSPSAVECCRSHWKK